MKDMWEYGIQFLKVSCTPEFVLKDKVENILQCYQPNWRISIGAVLLSAQIQGHSISVILNVSGSPRSYSMSMVIPELPEVAQWGRSKIKLFYLL